MNEYLYESPLMYENTSKDDIKEYKTKYKYNGKFDKYLIVASVLFGIIIVFAIIFNIPALYFISAVILAFLLFRLTRMHEMKRRDFLAEYEKYIINNTPEGYISISALYPTYIKTDNSKKTLSFIYGNKEYFNIPYTEILSYDILVDKHIFPYKRLPEKPDKKIATYVINIKCKNGVVVQVGYSNTNKYIRLKKSYSYQQFANTLAINKICLSLDKIIKKTYQK